jgi:hypothetical protein
MINRLKLLSIYFIFLSTFVNAKTLVNSNTQTWNGVYEYKTYAGRTAGGPPIMYNAVLTISPSGECKISEDGFQTFSRIKCTITKNDKGIDILFKGYLRENISDLGYKPGERLFSLFQDGKGKEVITDWGSLINEDFVKKKRGVFFKRKGKK